MAVTWKYDAALKRWEATTGGWRAFVERWASVSEWTAAIQVIDNQSIVYRSDHVFFWIEDAQKWCIEEIERRGKTETSHAE
jgi:hypothetical protein